MDFELNNIVSMLKTKFLTAIAIIMLSGSTLLLAISYDTAQRELESARAVLASQRTGTKSLRFLQMFIKDVIKADSEVNFETRLRLENNVRELGDEQVLVAWQNFVNSKNEAAAQEHVKNLLELLAAKVEAGH